MPFLSWLSLFLPCRASLVASEEVLNEIFDPCNALTKMPVTCLCWGQIFRHLLTDTRRTPALAAGANDIFRRCINAPNLASFTFPAGLRSFAHFPPLSRYFLIFL